MRALLLAGGSGGHLLPAMALAEHLCGQGECLILSTARPVDRIVQSQARTGIQHQSVTLKPFTPLIRWLSPLYVVGQLKAAFHVAQILKRTRPQVVVGFGGYPSVIGILLARLWGLPTLLHEQNLIPGRANRFLCRWVDGVAVSFPDTRSRLSPGAAVEVTGNPLRPQLFQADGHESRRFFGFDLERPVLLVTGGSQGSRAINQLVLGMWKFFSARARGRLQVLHVAGEADLEEAAAGYRNLGVEAKVFGFLAEMPMALACATLAISRAGATAIAELAARQVPAILIPYPHAGGHQRANAQWMAARGGALVLEETALTPQRLADELLRLLEEPGLLEKMRQGLPGSANGTAVKQLASLVERMAR